MPHRDETCAAALTLNFPQLGRTVATTGDETLLQSARRHGVRIVGACGGRGTCGACMVHITDGQIAADDDAPPSPDGPVRRKKWVRACRARARSDCTVEVAPRSLAPVARADVEGDGDATALPLAAAVAGHELRVAAPSLADPAADLDRVIGALVPSRDAPGRAPIDTIDLVAARQLPQTLRDAGWALRLCLRGTELIDVAPPGSRLLGLAVDLGTTNAAGFLVDLHSGARLAGLGLENPQVAWGADLISRLDYAVGGPAGAAAELRNAAVAAINALAHDLCAAVGARAAEIVDVAICGNTAMHHLLLGLPVRQLGRAPFVAAVRDGIDIKARELGVAVSPGAYVHLAPNVGGFVGGDHVAALLAAESHWRGAAASLVIDIGTNTEITLIHDGVFLSASSPSGPALEGGHISCGMRAAAGAIERVGLDAGRLAVRTIGDRPPVGLCGSGVLDALAALYRGGIVDRRGRIQAAHPDVGERDGQRYAQLAPGVRLTQADVRAVQLAKGAIRTAIDLLLAEAGLQSPAIGRFIIAGAFGAYVDIDSAVAIGLFPALPRERFVQIGNAAGAGVRLMLASTAARARARQLAAGCRYVEMSTRAEFQPTFMRNIGFH